MPRSLFKSVLGFVGCSGARNTNSKKDNNNDAKGSETEDLWTGVGPAKRVSVIPSSTSTVSYISVELKSKDLADDLCARKYCSTDDINNTFDRQGGKRNFSKRFSRSKNDFECRSLTTDINVGKQITRLTDTPGIKCRPRSIVVSCEVNAKHISKESSGEKSSSVKQDPKPSVNTSCPVADNKSRATTRSKDLEHGSPVGNNNLRIGSSGTKVTSTGAIGSLYDKYRVHSRKKLSSVTPVPDLQRQDANTKNEPHVSTTFIISLMSIDL